MAKIKPKSTPSKGSKNKFWEVFLKYLKLSLIIFFVSSITSVFVFRFINPPITYLMVQRCAEQLFDSNKQVKLKKTWMPLKNISPNLVYAVLAAEDQKFPSHFGFDFEGISKAWGNNQKGKKIKGASTISQQTAKNVFLWPGRSWVRKGLEAYFTVLIEIFWGKKRILEVYLNVIEMGIGVYGAEEASKYYFSKSTRNLSPSEAALIACILPAPLKWSVKNPKGFIFNKTMRIQRDIPFLKKEYGTFLL